MHHQKEKRGSNRAAPFYGFVGRKGHDEYEHIQKYGIDTFRTSKNGFFQMFKKAYLMGKHRVVRSIAFIPPLVGERSVSL